MNIDRKIENLLIIDGHTDIPRHLYLRDLEGVENSFHIDHYLPLKRGHVNIAVVNIFTKGIPEDALRQAMTQIYLINEAVKSNEDVVLIKDKEDLLHVVHSNKLGLILSLEGFEPLGENESLLNIYYELGVRAGMLTWNQPNVFASGPATNKKISSRGFKAINLMNHLGMIIDVSHINENGFWDILNTTTEPVIASHSNARKLFNHPRNLTDDQILAIAKSNGVIGVVPYFSKVDINDPEKIREDDDETESIDDYIAHIEYIVNLVGYDHVAFGFDFNLYLGDFGVKGIEDTEKIKAVIIALLDRGHSIDNVEKISGKNLLRIFEHFL